jgi:hypothetical protein
MNQTDATLAETLGKPPPVIAEFPQECVGQPGFPNANLGFLTPTDLAAGVRRDGGLLRLRDEEPLPRRGPARAPPDGRDARPSALPRQNRNSLPMLRARGGGGVWWGSTALGLVLGSGQCTAGRRSTARATTSWCGPARGG